MDLNNLTIGKKINYSLSVLITVFIIVFITIMVSLNKLETSVNGNFESHVFRENIKQAYIDYLLWLNNVNEIFTNEELKEIKVETDHYKSRFDFWYNNKNSSFLKLKFPELVKLFEEIELHHKKLHQSILEINKYLALETTEAKEQVREIYVKETSVEAKSIAVQMDKILNITNEIIIGNDEIIKSKQKVQRALLFATIAILLTYVLIIIVINNSVRKPLQKLLPYFLNISNGIIGKKTDIRGNGEIGQLSMAFNKMNNKVLEIVQDINNGADNIVNGSNQISEASQDLSNGANMQVSGSEQIASAIEEMTGNISNTKEIALQLVKDFEESGHQMERMNKASKDSLEAIENINDKISIINDIANQTNILALNAAVEAARAGEHGKGFAVVAAEVRKLAESSKIASDQINELSDQTLSFTSNTRNISEELANSYKISIERVNEVETSLSELNTGAEQINNSTVQMTNITQRNAASSEELAASSEEFASQAVMLKDIIGFFSTRKNGQSINTSEELINWGPQYFIGIQTIDEQHKVLVDLINKTYRYFGSNKNLKHLRKVINQLLEYTIFHFGEEEKYFLKFNYNEYEAHKRSHDSFIDKIQKFKIDVKSGDATVSFEIIDFLKDWLINHIQKSDKRYVTLFKEQGVK